MVWFAVLLSAALGGFIQSVTGFGSAVVMMTVLPYFFTMLVAPSVSTSICLALTGTITWKLRRHIKLSVMLLPTICYNIASIAMIKLLGGMNLQMLTVAFGVFLILLGGYFLLFAKDKRIHFTTLLTIVFALIAGTCGGLFSIGGPFMAIYFLAATNDREEYLANMQSHFFVGNLVNMAARITAGYYTLDLLPFSLIGIVGVVCGQKFGLKVGSKLNAAKLRTVVYGYVVLSGVVTVIQALLK